MLIRQLELLYLRERRTASRSLEALSLLRCLARPPRPGLGVMPDLDALEAYRVG
jgi:hypothetical protein